MVKAERVRLREAHSDLCKGEGSSARTFDRTVHINAFNTSNLHKRLDEIEARLRKYEVYVY